MYERFTDSCLKDRKTEILFVHLPTTHVRATNGRVIFSPFEANRKMIFYYKMSRINVKLMILDQLEVDLKNFFKKREVLNLIH